MTSKHQSHSHNPKCDKVCACLIDIKHGYSTLICKCKCINTQYLPSWIGIKDYRVSRSLFTSRQVSRQVYITHIYASLSSCCFLSRSAGWGWADKTHSAGLGRCELSISESPRYLSLVSQSLLRNKTTLKRGRARAVNSVNFWRINTWNVPQLNWLESEVMD